MWATVAHLSTMNASKIWHQNGTKNNKSFIPHASRSLLCIRFVAVAFWAKKQFFLRWGPPWPIFALSSIQRALRSCFISNFVEFGSGVFRGEVKNVSAIQRPGRPSCFSDQPEKHKLGRGCWDLCFLSRFVEIPLAVSTEKSKMSQLIRGRGGHLVFPNRPENTNLVEGFEILLPIKFGWIWFSGFRGEVENVSANQRPGRPSSFLIGPKNTNLVEGVEILLPVKFPWIPFSSFYREVENVSANQRPGGHLVFWSAAW